MAGFIERIHLKQNGWVPNNPRESVIIHRGVFEGTREQTVAAFEARFTQAGWPPDWRDTIFTYHHYHSTAHEALGVASGHAVLMLGGPGGRDIVVASGDALILPAGTGHCQVSASEDFLVVGAYPLGQTWDICTEAPTPAQQSSINGLPSPRDPIGGA